MESERDDTSCKHHGKDSRKHHGKDSRNRKNLPRCRDSGKKAHPDYHSAARHVKAAARLYNESVELFNIYHCQECGYWHVGHDRKKMPVAADTITEMVNFITVRGRRGRNKLKRVVDSLVPLEPAKPISKCDKRVKKKRETTDEYEWQEWAQA
jgi:hypothetical protein